MQNWPITDYLNPSHPVQENILRTFAEMCGAPLDQIEVGIDGCSAPNFAVPLANAALAYARLCDPVGLSIQRASACRTILRAMTHFPFMIAGPGRFDTRLMEVTKGRIVSKGGAEGYQGIGLLPGAIRPDSPALGIALKITDGDLQGRARPATSLEILRQLNALTPSELDAVAEFGPKISLRNWRNLNVGEMRPCFLLQSDGWLQSVRI